MDINADAMLMQTPCENACGVPSQLLIKMDSLCHYPDEAPIRVEYAVCLHCAPALLHHLFEQLMAGVALSHEHQQRRN